MVFDVEVHVPVEEAEERIEDDCARAEAEVRDVVCHSNVLGVVAQEEDEAAIGRAEGDKDRELPPAQVERDADEHEVAQEHDAVPAEETLSAFYVFRREEDLVPTWIEVFEEAPAEGAADTAVRTQGVDKSTAQEAFECEVHGEDDFAVFGRMEGVFVVFGMAGPEVDRVIPAEEAEEVEKEDVERLGAEYGAVHQFVEAVDDEGVACAV